MAAMNFTACSDLGFKSEGGFVNDPRDPGGATNMGITIATARSVYGKSYSVAQLKAMTKEQARAIYRHLYWDTVNGDKLPVGVDYVVYDYGINSGTGRPIAVVHELLNITGKKIDDVCITALNAYDTESIIDAICDERLEYMQRIDSGRLWKVYSKGWGSRVASVRATAKAMARRVPIAITAETGASHAGAKAVQKPATVPTAGATAAAATVATASAVGAVSHFHLGDLGIALTGAAAVSVATIAGAFAYIVHGATTHPTETTAAVRPLTPKGA